MHPAIVTILMMVLSAFQPAMTAAATAPAGLDGAADGTYRFHYPTRDGVSGDCNGFRIESGDGDYISYHRGTWPDHEMGPGPAWVSVTLQDGEVRSLDLAVGRCAAMAGDDVIELGEVDAGETAFWLLELAGAARADVAEDALSAASVARDAELAEPLIRLAGNRRLDEDVRLSALHWCAALAGDVVIEPVRHLIDDDDESMEVRENAVFALAQVENDEALGLLLEIGRSHDQPQIRRMALFALGQFDDDRVVALYEEILLGE